MIEFNAVEYLTYVASMRAQVAYCQPHCRTELARDMHGAFIDKLDAMRADLEKEVVIKAACGAGRGLPEGDADYAIYLRCSLFAQKWVWAGAISLLDPIHATTQVGGEPCRVNLSYTVVPNAELGGLGPLLETTRNDIGVNFIVARR